MDRRKGKQHSVKDGRIARREKVKKAAETLKNRNKKAAAAQKTSEQIAHLSKTQPGKRATGNQKECSAATELKRLQTTQGFWADSCSRGTQPVDRSKLARKILTKQLRRRKKNLKSSSSNTPSSDASSKKKTAKASGEKSKTVKEVFDKSSSNVKSNPLAELRRLQTTEGFWAPSFTSLVNQSKETVKTVSVKSLSSLTHELKRLKTTKGFWSPNEGPVPSSRDDSPSSTSSLDRTTRKGTGKLDNVDKGSVCSEDGVVSQTPTGKGSDSSGHKSRTAVRVVTKIKSNILKEESATESRQPSLRNKSKETDVSNNKGLRTSPKTAGKDTKSTTSGSQKNEKEAEVPPDKELEKSTRKKKQTIVTKRGKEESHKADSQAVAEKNMVVVEDSQSGLGVTLGAKRTDEKPQKSHLRMTKQSPKSPKQGLKSQQLSGYHRLKRKSALTRAHRDLPSPKKTRLSAPMSAEVVVVKGNDKDDTSEMYVSPSPKKLRSSQNDDKSVGSVKRKCSSKNQLTPVSQKSRGGISMEIKDDTKGEKTDQEIVDLLKSKELKRLSTTDGFWSPPPEIGAILDSSPHRLRVSNKRQKSPPKSPSRQQSSLLQHRKKKLKSLKKAAMMSHTVVTVKRDKARINSPHFSKDEGVEGENNVLSASDDLSVGKRSRINQLDQIMDDCSLGGVKSKRRDRRVGSLEKLDVEDKSKVIVKNTGLVRSNSFGNIFDIASTSEFMTGISQMKEDGQAERKDCDDGNKAAIDIGVGKAQQEEERLSKDTVMKSHSSSVKGKITTLCMDNMLLLLQGPKKVEVCGNEASSTDSELPKLELLDCSEAKDIDVNSTPAKEKIDSNTALESGQSCIAASAADESSMKAFEEEQANVSGIEENEVIINSEKELPEESCPLVAEGLDCNELNENLSTVEAAGDESGNNDCSNELGEGSQSKEDDSNEKKEVFDSMDSTSSNLCDTNPEEVTAADDPPVLNEEITLNHVQTEKGVESLSEKEMGGDSQSSHLEVEDPSLLAPENKVSSCVPESVSEVELDDTTVSEETDFQHKVDECDSLTTKQDEQCVFSAASTRETIDAGDAHAKELITSDFANSDDVEEKTMSSQLETEDVVSPVEIENKKEEKELEREDIDGSISECRSETLDVHENSIASDVPDVSPEDASSASVLPVDATANQNSAPTAEGSEQSLITVSTDNNVMKMLPQSTSTPTKLPFKRRDRRRKRNRWKKGVLTKAIGSTNTYKATTTAAMTNETNSLVGANDVSIKDNEHLAARKIKVQTVRLRKKQTMLSRLNTEATYAVPLTEDQRLLTRTQKRGVVQLTSEPRGSNRGRGGKRGRGRGKRQNSEPRLQSAATSELFINIPELSSQCSGSLPLPVLKPLENLAPSDQDGPALDAPPVLTPQFPCSFEDALKTDMDGSGSNNDMVEEFVDDMNLHLYWSDDESKEKGPKNPSVTAKQSPKTSQLKEEVIDSVEPVPVVVAKPSKKLKGKKGRPPGIKATGHSPKLSKKGLYQPKLTELVRTFEFRKKTTRSPLEMLEMKRRQEEAIYDLQEQQRISRINQKREKRIAKITSEDISWPSSDDEEEEEEDSFSGTVVKPCFVVLNDFVKKLNLDGKFVASGSDVCSNPYSLEYEDDLNDEDWYADLEDVEEDDDELAQEDSKRRPHIPRLKLKRVLKGGKAKSTKIKNLVSQLKSPEEEPLKLVIKTEPEEQSRDQPEPAGVPETSHTGFVGSYLDFLKERPAERRSKHLKVKTKGLTKEQPSELSGKSSNEESASGSTPIAGEKVIEENPDVEPLKSGSGDHSLEVSESQRLERADPSDTDKKEESSMEETTDEMVDISQKETESAAVKELDSEGIVSEEKTSSSLMAEDATVQTLDIENSVVSPKETSSSSVGIEQTVEQDATGVIENEVQSTDHDSTKDSACEESSTIYQPAESSPKSSDISETVTAIGVEDVSSKVNNNNEDKSSPLASHGSESDLICSPVHSTSEETPEPSEYTKLKTITAQDRVPSSFRYTCKRCGFASSTRLIIESHIYSHIPGAQFQCAPCQSEFSSMAAAASHMKNTHPSTDHKVKITGYVTESSFYDKTTNSTETAVEQQQESTTTTSTSPRSGPNNNSTSTGTGGQSPPFIISVVVSGGSGNRAVRSGSASRRFVCSHCGFSTNVKEDIEQHVSDLHPSKGLYACTLCNESVFSSEEDIKQHCLSIHPSRPRPYQKLPDFYNADHLAKMEKQKSGPEEIAGSNVYHVNSVLNVADVDSTSVDHRLKARDYLDLQDDWKGKKSVEADSTTASDYYSQDNTDKSSDVAEENVGQSSVPSEDLSSIPTTSPCKDKEEEVVAQENQTPVSVSVSAPASESERPMEEECVGDVQSADDGAAAAAVGVEETAADDAVEEEEASAAAVYEEEDASAVADEEEQAVAVATSPACHTHGVENLVEQAETNHFGMKIVEVVSLSGQQAEDFHRDDDKQPDEQSNMDDNCQAAMANIASDDQLGESHDTQQTSPPIPTDTVTNSSVPASTETLSSSSPSAIPPEVLVSQPSPSVLGKETQNQIHENSSEEIPAEVNNVAPDPGLPPVSSTPQPAASASCEVSSSDRSSTTTPVSTEEAASSSSSPASQSPSSAVSKGALSYKCKACKVHTPYLLMMVKHLKSRHPTVRCFSCPYCKSDSSFGSQKQLRFHVKSLHPLMVDKNEVSLSKEAKKLVEAMVLPSSSQCTRVGSRLVLEEDIHTCTVCSLRMTSLCAVYDHLNEKHSDLFEFVCPVCQAYKSKSLHNISVHCNSQHGSKLDRDKVHVSVPKYLFTILTCISNNGKYIEKALLSESSSTSSKSSSTTTTTSTPQSPSQSAGAAVSAPTAASENVNQSRSEQPRTPHPSSIDPARGSTSTNFIGANQQQQVPVPSGSGVSFGSSPSNQRSVNVISSALFDTSSMAAISTGLRGSNAPNPPSRQLQSASSKQGRPLSAKSVRATGLPVLNIPSVNVKQKNSSAPYPSSKHGSSSKSSSYHHSHHHPQPLVTSPTTPSDAEHLPDNEPNPDAFKIFNLRPIAPSAIAAAPPPSVMPPVQLAMPPGVPSVFPPVSSASLALGFIPGPMVGFPAGMVIPQNFVHNAFPFPVIRPAPANIGISSVANPTLSSALKRPPTLSPSPIHFHQQQQQQHPSHQTRPMTAPLMPSPSTSTEIHRHLQSPSPQLAHQNIYPAHKHHHRRGGPGTVSSPGVAANINPYTPRHLTAPPPPNVLPIEHLQQQQRHPFAGTADWLLQHNPIMSTVTGFASQQPPPSSSSATHHPPSPAFQQQQQQLQPASKSPVAAPAVLSAPGLSSSSSSGGKKGKRGSQMYQCPYCTGFVELKALEVASHIHQLHPGRPVTFRKIPN